ncbi:hypothetical protein D3C72_2197650 [compost metagenome]
MNALINRISTTSLFRKDLDYHLVRASMVIIFLFFGYQKWLMEGRAEQHTRSLQQELTAPWMHR